MLRASYLRIKRSVVPINVKSCVGLGLAFLYSFLKSITHMAFLGFSQVQGAENTHPDSSRSLVQTNKSQFPQLALRILHDLLLIYILRHGLLHSPSHSLLQTKWAIYIPEHTIIPHAFLLKAVTHSGSLLGNALLSPSCTY